MRCQVPTWRANPLHPECDTWCDFPVADRANGVAQWIAAAKADPSLIKAPWLLMIETDYVWKKPVGWPPAVGRVGRVQEPARVRPFMGTLLTAAGWCGASHHEEKRTQPVPGMGLHWQRSLSAVLLLMTALGSRLCNLWEPGADGRMR
jgi:hypothetical protein